jgi:hypothetical protein
VRKSLLLLLALMAGVAAAPAHAAVSRDCGLTPRVDGRKYQVEVVKGKVACKTARRVATKFLRDSTYDRPWFCVRGHASQNQDWAASCSRDKVLFRVWAPT